MFDPPPDITYSIKMGSIHESISLWLTIRQCRLHTMSSLLKYLVAHCFFKPFIKLLPVQNQSIADILLFKNHERTRCKLATVWNDRGTSDEIYFNKKTGLTIDLLTAPNISNYPRIAVYSKKLKIQFRTGLY